MQEFFTISLRLVDKISLTFSMEWGTIEVYEVFPNGNLKRR